jgi:hypothetical protein
MPLPPFTRFISFLVLAQKLLSSQQLQWRFPAFF